MSVDSTAAQNVGSQEQPLRPNRTDGYRHPHDPPSLTETANDAVECFQHYAKERPDVVAMACLGVGFILGWKLKPW